MPLMLSMPFARPRPMKAPIFFVTLDGDPTLAAASIARLHSATILSAAAFTAPILDRRPLATPAPILAPTLFAFPTPDRRALTMPETMLRAVDFARPPALRIAPTNLDMPERAALGSLFKPLLMPFSRLLPICFPAVFACVLPLRNWEVMFVMELRTVEAALVMPLRIAVDADVIPFRIAFEAAVMPLLIAEEICDIPVLVAAVDLLIPLRTAATVLVMPDWTPF